MGRKRWIGRPALVAAVLIGASGGCASLDGPADDLDRPQLWTMFDVREALTAGAPIAAVESYPTGIDAQEILAPQDDGTATLKIIPAFSEGAPAAYVMPEVWTYFEQVWV